MFWINTNTGDRVVLPSEVTRNHIQMTSTGIYLAESYVVNGGHHCNLFRRNFPVQCGHNVDDTLYIVELILRRMIQLR